MKNKFDPKFVLEKETTEPTFIDYKEPGFVESVDNKIYFYSDIETDKILILIKIIRDKENEMLVKQRTWELESPPAIHLHIQSNGGSVYSGLAAFDVIKNVKVPLYTYVDGMAASAATLLSIAGDKRFIYKNSFMMIHQITGYYWGDMSYQESKDQIKNLDMITNAVKKLYVENTKITNQQINKHLTNNIYFTAKDALKYGMVDEIL